MPPGSANTSNGFGTEEEKYYMNRRNLKLFLDKPLRWNGEKNKLPILFSWTENTNVRESETYLQRQLLAVSKNLISDWLTPAQQLDPKIYKGESTALIIKRKITGL